VGFHHAHQDLQVREPSGLIPSFCILLSAGTVVPAFFILDFGFWILDWDGESGVRFGIWDFGFCIFVFFLVFWFFGFSRRRRRQHKAPSVSWG